MKFRTRLLAAQLAPLVPLLLTGLLTVTALFTMTRSVRQVSEVQIRKIEVAAETIELFRQEYASLELYAATGDTRYLEEGERRSNSVRARLEILSPGDTELVQALNDYEALSGLGGGPAETDAASRHARDMVRALQAEHTALRDGLQDELSRVAATGGSTGAFIIFMVGLVLVIGGFISYLVTRDLSRSVRELDRGTAALAAGDFEYRLAVDGDDEFAQLGDAFNHMAGRIAALDRMKIDFFANVSHDLKTPLTSMSEAVDLMAEEVPGPLTTKQRRLIRILRDDVRRLRSLVANVLDLSRMGTRQADLAPGDLEICVARVRDDLELLAARKRVRIELDVPAGLPKVFVNRGMIEQVVMNLVTNALKFSPRDGVVRLEAREGAREGDRDAIRVVVQDQGPGVPEGYRTRIFERFFQVDGKQGGTGLGLYICKEILTAHGGRIWVEEAEDGGAAFVFTLPVA